MVVVALAAAAVLAAPALAAPTKVSVYGTGLFNPKGIVFGSDGTLYVAESGPPGDVKVPLPVNFGGSGPIGTRASVSKIPAAGGKAQKFVTGLPNIGLYGGAEHLDAAVEADVRQTGDELLRLAAACRDLRDARARADRAGAAEVHGQRHLHVPDRKSVV